MTFPARIELAPQKVIGQVDSRLYGANLEHFGEAIYGGIWTEMIRSPKFSGTDPRYYEQVRDMGRNPDHGVVLPWQAVNPDSQRVIFDHDNTIFFTGSQSQRITVREDDGLEHGIGQEDLYLQAGRSYRLRLTLLGEGQPVQVRVGDQSWQLKAAASDWQNYQTVLQPTHSAENGRLEITFHGKFSLWVGVASLRPADSAHGFRPDLLESMRAWQPTHLRWPGGNFASAYHWQMGTGDPDRRPPYLDPAFHLWESNLVGTDEFVQFCQLSGAEPMLTVNLGDGSPEEAAAWVEYCNGSTKTAMGALRSQNGHPEPYGIKTWYVGNEQFGNWQVGHCDPETYAHRYLEFARAMRAVDSDLNLIAVGVPGESYGHWNQRLLEIAASEIDLLSLHYYSIRTWRLETPPSPEELILAKLAAGHEAKEVLEATLAATARYSDPPVPIAFDEWNTNTRGKPPLWIEDYNLADGLYTASVLHACLRRCDRVKISAIYNLVNAMGNYRISPRSVWKTPATLVMELLTRHRGPLSIHCQVESPTFGVEEMFHQAAYPEVPLLDAAATYDPNGGTIYLSVVNRSRDQTARILVEGVEAAGLAQNFQIAGEQALLENTEQEPEAVTIARSELDLSEPYLTVPPLSFTLLQFQQAGT